MHSWCKKCKQYEGRESKNVPSQRKVFPGGSLAHVAPESGFPPPQSQEHGGPAVTTGRPFCGLCLQQTSGALLPLTGSAGGPGPGALPVAPRFGPGSPSLVFPNLRRHLSRPSWGDRSRIVRRPGSRPSQVTSQLCRSRGSQILTADVTSEPRFSYLKVGDSVHLKELL